MSFVAYFRGNPSIARPRDEDVSRDTNCERPTNEVIMASKFCRVIMTKKEKKEGNRSITLVEEYLDKYLQSPHYRFTRLSSTRIVCVFLCFVLFFLRRNMIC